MLSRVRYALARNKEPIFLVADKARDLMYGTQSKVLVKGSPKSLIDSFSGSCLPGILTEGKKGVRYLLIDKSLVLEQFGD